MRGDHLSQQVVSRLDGQALVAAVHRMADPVRFRCVEEDAMANIGDQLRLTSDVLDEDSAKRQDERRSRRLLDGTATTMLGPAIDNANAPKRAVVRECCRQGHVDGPVTRNCRAMQLQAAAAFLPLPGIGTYRVKTSRRTPA